MTRPAAAQTRPGETPTAAGPSIRGEVGRSRYAQLAEALRIRILKGEWSPGGDALPSEATLALQHKVALGTMRRALELLVDEGLVERIHGRGTFVHRGLSGATTLRFFRFGTKGGEVPQSRIVSVKQAVPPAAVQRRLGQEAGQAGLHVVRLRTLGNAPCLLENIWLPLPLFEALADFAADKWGGLLYPMYAQRCGVHVHRAVDEIGFGSLSGAQGRHLGLPAGHPCAVVERSAFDLSGRCVETRVTRGDAKAFHYTVTLN